jgi:hypothetical protein
MSMNTRSMFGVALVSTAILSSDTSTAVPTAVDLANYFPVGKREVKFIVAVTNPSTTLGAAVTVTLQECASTATASFTNIVDYAGTTATWTSGVNTSTAFEFNGIVTKRYVRAIWTASTSTGTTLGVVAMAFPFVRAS